jgi:hypothetical protein
VKICPDTAFQIYTLDGHLPNFQVIDGQVACSDLGVRRDRIVFAAQFSAEPSLATIRLVIAEFSKLEIGGDVIETNLRGSQHS